jgi:hypothetical protein
LRRSLVAIALLTVMACKPKTSQYTFPDDYANAFCAKAEVCLLPELPNTREECVAVMLPAIEYLEDECGNFDLSTARNCLAEVRQMSCNDALLYQDPYQNPAACDSVYSCYRSF